MGVRLGVLGTTVVEGATLTRRDRVVAAALVMAVPEPLSADRLASALWGEQVPATWTKVVQGSVSRLRRALPPESIEHGPGGYRLALRPEEIDLVAFERLGAQAEHLARTDPEAAMGHLEACRRLWRGRPFADLSDWPDALGTVSRLEARRSALEELAVTIHLSAGRLEEAIAQGSELVADEPFAEHRAALLATALYRAGRPVEALAVLRRTAAALGDELGLEPGPELVALEAAVLQHDPEVLGSSALRSAAPPGSTRRRPTFVGRTTELSAVRDALGTARVVTIAGPGGVGKTRLAREVSAVEVRGDGAAVVELAGLRHDEDVVAATVGRALGVSAPGRDQMAALRQFLAHRQQLLVLDNAEHLLPAVRELVEALAPGSPQLAVLVTSREPLGVEGERVVRLEGLDPDAATQLFVEQAAAQGAPAAASEHVVIAALCARLDHLPLAIELAAARTTALSPVEILERLGERLTLLSDARAGRPLRHQSLRAVFEWSHGLLPAAAQRVTEGISLLPAGATLETLEAVFGPVVDGDVAEVVTDLVDASMLERTRDPDGSSRYRLPATCRPFAMDGLVRAGHLADVQGRVLDWVAAWATRAQAGLAGTEERRWRAAVEAERSTIGEAVAIAVARDEPHLAADICRSLSAYPTYALDLSAVPWFERTAVAGATHGTPDAVVLGVLALLRWLAGDPAGAEEAAGAVERLPRAEPQARAFASHVHGLVAGSVEHLRDAVHHADASPVLGMAVGFRVPLVLALSATSAEEATHIAAEAWAIAARSRVPSDLASAHVSAAATVIEVDGASARRHLEEARAIGADVGNRMLAAMCDVLESLLPADEPLVGARTAVAAAATLLDRGARVQAAMALLRAADVLIAAGEDELSAVLLRAVEASGTADWRRLRGALRLVHLHEPVESTPFPPPPLDLGAAVEHGLSALYTRS